MRGMSVLAFTAITALLLTAVALVAWHPGSAGISMPVALARASGANQSWAADVENGKALHVVDVVYEKDTNKEGSFPVPDSSVQEFWLQYPASGAPVFCSVVRAGGQVVERSTYDPSKDELVSVNPATGARRSTPGGVYKNVAAFRSSLERAVAQAVGTKGAHILHGDTSLGKAADVIVVRAPAAATASAGDDAGAVPQAEMRLYFDQSTGEQFASERWSVPAGDAPVLLFRRTRTISTTEVPSCQ